MEGMDSKERDWKRVTGSEGQEERDGKGGKERRNRKQGTGS